MTKPPKNLPAGMQGWAPAPTMFIRFKGVWDMQDFYVRLIDWFRKRKYHFHEKAYKHKHPSPFGVERQYVWEAERNENDYVQAKINLYFHTYDAHEIEIILPDGSKKEMTQGRLWVEFRISLTFDYEKRWNRKEFYKHLRRFYNEYVIRKKTMQGYAPKYRQEIYDLHAYVKHLLQFENDQYVWKNAAGVHKRT